MSRFLDLAYRVALKDWSKRPMSEKSKRMAAVVVRGGQVLSFATNHHHRHAEARALRPHMDYTGATVYVMRLNKKVSKPCPECQNALKAAGIRKAVYVNLTCSVESLTL